MKRKGKPEEVGYLETISVTEAAEMTGLSDQAIYRAIHSDRLNAIRCGGRALLFRRDVEQYQNARRGRPRKDGVDQQQAGD